MRSRHVELVESMTRIAEVKQAQVDSADCSRIVLPHEDIPAHSFDSDFEHARFNAFSLQSLIEAGPYSGESPLVPRYVRPALHRTLNGLQSIARMKPSETLFERNRIINDAGLLVLHFAAHFPNTRNNENPQSVSQAVDVRNYGERGRFYVRHADEVAFLLKHATMPDIGDVLKTVVEAKDLLQRVSPDQYGFLSEVREDDGKVVVGLFD